MYRITVKDEAKEMYFPDYLHDCVCDEIKRDNEGHIFPVVNGHVQLSYRYVETDCIISKPFGFVSTFCKEDL